MNRRFFMILMAILTGMLGALLCLARGTSMSASAMAPFSPSAEGLHRSLALSGWTTTTFQTSHEVGYAAVLQSDGKIIVAAKLYHQVDENNIGLFSCMLARYNSNGSLDQSFGVSGTLTTYAFGSTKYTFGDPGIDCGEPALQEDDKIIIAHFIHGAIVMTRYHPNGSLDQNFGVDGAVITDLPFSKWNTEHDLSALTLQEDGKIVVSVSSMCSLDRHDYILARYHPDGSLDNDFGSGGMVLVSEVKFAPNDLALQKDGKILIGGGYLDQWKGWWGGLMRLNSDGSEDETFSPSDGGQILTLQKDGKIVSAEQADIWYPLFREYIHLSRILPDGTRDWSTEVHLGEKGNAKALLLQEDGKIIVAGTTGDNNFALTRFDTDGNLDIDFGINGLVITDLGRYEGGFDALLQPDGKIIVVGSSNVNNTLDLALARYNPDGSQDQSFGSSGIVITDFDMKQRFASMIEDIVLKPDGKLIAAGCLVDTFCANFALAGYNPDGSLDTSFGTGGQLVVDIGQHWQKFDDYLDGINALALQPNGKIAAAGEIMGNFGVARFNPDGSPDNDFLKNTRTMPLGTGRANDLALQEDGKILVVGESSGYEPDHNEFSLARFNPDGSLDTSFGISGTQNTDFFGNYRNDIQHPEALILQDDGKIILTGYTEITRTSETRTYYSMHFALARFNPDGGPDTSFGADGIQIMEIHGASDYGYPLALALQDDGKIIAAGTTYIPKRRSHFALARCHPDGNLDQSFGVGGWVTTTLGVESEATDIVVQPDGKILVAGSMLSIYGRDYEFTLVRYNPDGSLDNSFGIGGVVTTDFYGKSDSGKALVLQEDGKIILAGNTQPVDPPYGILLTSHFAVARYNPDGSLDPSFGNEIILLYLPLVAR